MLSSKTKPETLFLPLDEQLGKINEIQMLMQFQQPEVPETPEILDEYQHTEMVLLTLGTIRQLFEVVSHM